MGKSFTNTVGSTFLPFFISASSMSIAGTVNSYYRARTSYSGNYNKKLIEAGYKPVSSNKVYNFYIDLITENQGSFHFEKGRIVRELVIIDEAVQDKHVFYKLNNPFAEVVEIKKGTGILGLFNTLSKYRNLESVHLVSHGKPGLLQIGGEELTKESLEKNVEAFTAINRSIRSGGDLLLYGCELAEGEEGEDFLQIIKDNTHIDVSASDNKTGNKEYFADWDLEIEIGDIDAKPLPESIAMKDFTGLLQFTGDVISAAAGNVTDGATEALLSSGETLQFPTGKFYNNSNPYVKFSGDQVFQRMQFKSYGSFYLSGDMVVYNNHNESVQVGVYGYDATNSAGYGIYFSQFIPAKSEFTINFESDLSNISNYYFHYILISARNNSVSLNADLLIKSLGVKDAPGVLPVELTTFSALVRDNSVELNWETATEINNYGFEIERCETEDVRSEKWEKIGFVVGHGNSNSPKSYNFIDENIVSGDYSYRLKQIDFGGTFEYSDVVNVFMGIPTEFSLEQNYPNPFNPETRIRYSIPVESRVKIAIYNTVGQLVDLLENNVQNAGTYELDFNASNLSSGVYIYRMDAESTDGANSFSKINKMLLIK